MKFTLCAILSALAAVAVASPAGDGSFYDKAQDVTCKADESGAINCTQGQVGNAPELGNVLASREVSNLDKRACLHVVCAASCYAKGYCNATCSNGSCKCSNKKIGMFCFND